MVNPTGFGLNGCPISVGVNWGEWSVECDGAVQCSLSSSGSSYLGMVILLVIGDDAYPVVGGRG